MSLQRISVAVPLADRETKPAEFIPVFHDWIRRGAVEGLLIDVANYSHVHNGPGVLLIGHEGDYSIDTADGHPALRYSMKRDQQGEPRELVARAFRRLQGAAAESEKDSGRGVNANEITVRIYDRLAAPNSSAAFEELRPVIEGGIQDVLGADTALSSSTTSDDPRAPLSVRVRVG